MLLLCGRFALEQTNSPKLDYLLLRDGKKMNLQLSEVQMELLDCFSASVVLLSCTWREARWEQTVWKWSSVLACCWTVHMGNSIRTLNFIFSSRVSKEKHNAVWKTLKLESLVMTGSTWISIISALVNISVLYRRPFWQAHLKCLYWWSYKSRPLHRTGFDLW